MKSRRKLIKHWRNEDEFCLSHEERARIVDKIAEVQQEQAEIAQEIERICTFDLSYTLGKDDLNRVIVKAPRIIERYFYSNGEAFVYEVIRKQIVRGNTSIMDCIIHENEEFNKDKDESILLPSCIEQVVNKLLTSQSRAIQTYLQRISSSYTLFCFLRETPDIQSATNKLFSHGKLWVDTTLLIMIFAEQLVDENERNITRLFDVCIKSGIELRVTKGIIEEIIGHMNKSLACANHYGNWSGRLPYLYERYLYSGRAVTGFARWLLDFRGDERPDDDIIQYLDCKLGFRVENLSDYINEKQTEFRYQVERIWTNEHIKRRSDDSSIDPGLTAKLIKHDIESYLGVIALRKTERTTELGYRNWLLTLDKTAWQIQNLIRRETKGSIPSSPLMSLDFLKNSMLYGPTRAQSCQKHNLILPMILDAEMTDSYDQINNCDIVAIARKIREDNEDKDEFIIRRLVRDEIDRARKTNGAKNSDIDEDLNI